MSETFTSIVKDSGLPEFREAMEAIGIYAIQVIGIGGDHVNLSGTKTEVEVGPGAVAVEYEVPNQTTYHEAITQLVESPLKV